MDMTKEFITFNEWFGELKRVGLARDLVIGDARFWSTFYQDGFTPDEAIFARHS